MFSGKIVRALIVVALAGEDASIFVSPGRNPTLETGFFSESTGPKASFGKKTRFLDAHASVLFVLDANNCSTTGTNG